MSNETKVLMYRTRGCPFCVMAAEMLAAKTVPFEEVFLDDHPDRRGFTANILPGHHTVPLILIDDEPIGGLDQLRQLDQAGKLDQLLAG